MDKEAITFIALVLFLNESPTPIQYTSKPVIDSELTKVKNKNLTSGDNLILSMCCDKRVIHPFPAICPPENIRSHLQKCDYNLIERARSFDRL